MERVRDLSPVGTPPPLVKRVPLFFAAVRFEETVFALPFAYAGMVLAADGLPTWHQFAWITVAMVSGRTLGMSANRIIDRHIDARNPRTAGRHLPTGVLKLYDMVALAAMSLVVLLVAAAQLNTLALSPLAIGYLILYPYTKRFTWTANLALGVALAIAPAGAWVGVRGALSWEPVLLAGAVALWAGSFDILYHVQDRDFYVDRGLHSMAQRFGVQAAFPLGPYARRAGRRDPRSARPRHGAGLPLLRGVCPRRRFAGLQAPHRLARRPVPSRHGLLQDQRLRLDCHVRVDRRRGAGILVVRRR